nr:type II secretion system protein [Clostridium gasigenes]
MEDEAVFKNSKRVKSKGFTLVEIVVVLAIIGILATIVTPNLTSYIKESKKVRVIEQARKVVISVEAVNTKSPNSIEKNKKINEIKINLGGLITDEDINLLDPSNKTVQDCYNVIDSENYTFTIGDSNEIVNINSIK